MLEEWDDYKEIPIELAEHFKRNKQNGKFNLCFFGSIHKTYNLDVLIDAIIDMKRDDIALTLIGPGHDKEELMKLAEGHEDKVKFFEPIPKTSIPDLFNYIDASFVGAKSQRIFRFGICMNKLFDSMMGGKPILYMVDAPNNYVEKYNCGIVVTGESKEVLESSIIELLSLDKSKRNELGFNGHRAAKEVFNYNSLAKAFEKVMIE